MENVLAVGLVEIMGKKIDELGGELKSIRV